MTQYGFGTTGQVLTSNGPGVQPSFQNAGGGGPGAFTYIDLPNTDATTPIGQIRFGMDTYISNYGTSNFFLGQGSGNQTMTGLENICLGRANGASLTTGADNTFVGHNSGVVCDVGINNNSCGAASLNQLTSGNHNCAMGVNSLARLQTGSYNTCISDLSGFNYTTSESSNICIGSLGTTGESNVMRLGTTGSGNGQVSACYIAGVDGVTVTGTAVLCASDGQFGTISSSERYKKDIKPIDKSVSILNLVPSEFVYKADASQSKQYGLIAEQVHEDFPYLCFYKDGKPESVKYHELPTLLLAEIQKLNDRIKSLEALVNPGH